MGEILASQATAEAGRLFRKMNSSRRLPPIPDVVLKLSQEQTVHIFNVGPWPHEVCLGNAGTFYIPACEKGKEYSALRPIPGVDFHPIVIDEKNFAYLQDSGRYIAEQVLGIGRGFSPKQALTHQGVFIAEGKKPTKDELQTARENLRAYFEALVEEARGFWNEDQRTAHKYILGKHRLAAREIGLEDEVWMTTAKAEAKQKCPLCGTNAGPQQVICTNCHFIFDEAQYKALQSRIAK